MQRLTPRQLGAYGERLACRYLADHGYAILARNWRCARGELDVVATDGPHLAVCEVKTRSGSSFGEPFEAVTAVKLLRLRALGQLWIQSHRGGERPSGVLRVDVISIKRPPTGPASIEHLMGVS